MASGLAQPPFLIAGHLAIDFVNSRATPGGVVLDWLRDAQSMLDWLEAMSIFPAAALRRLQRNATPGRLEQAARRMRELRELIRGQLSQPARLCTHARLWKSLNDILARGSAFDVLCNDGQGARLESRERLQQPDQLLVPIAKAIAQLIAQEDLDRLHACEGTDCSLWFLDLTKTGHRRFCSASTCGNRAKVAAFRSRQRNRPDG